MSKVFLLGECMVELLRSSPGQMQQGFAGDVFNTAVYLKRAFADVQVNMVTAIGTDQFSDAMLQLFQAEQLGTDSVFRSTQHIPGLYAIQTDAKGERSFTYWRENSAARQIMQFLDNDFVSQVGENDMLFFSGISLAVIQPLQRDKFWQLIKQLNAKGVTLVFDPNYRARLWQSPEHAKNQFELAFTWADIVLPGVDDFASLYSLNTVEAVQQFCKPFGIKELVIKNGENSVYCVADNTVHHIEIQPVTHVVDTTSAGDSFNGVYLGARLHGMSICNAISLAAKAAGHVIQHKGAIVPRDGFVQLMQQHIALL